LKAPLVETPDELNFSIFKHHSFFVSFFDKSFQLADVRASPRFPGSFAKRSLKRGIINGFVCMM